MFNLTNCVVFLQTYLKPLTHFIKLGQEHVYIVLHHLGAKSCHFQMQWLWFLITARNPFTFSAPHNSKQFGWLQDNSVNSLKVMCIEADSSDSLLMIFGHVAWRSVFSGFVFFADAFFLKWEISFLWPPQYKINIYVYISCFSNKSIYLLSLMFLVH